MKTMREMHQRMVTATPAERQALMAEHMAMMQLMMDMMADRMRPATASQ